MPIGVKDTSKTHWRVHKLGMDHSIFGLLSMYQSLKTEANDP